MARADWQDINGVLLLNKPLGLSSNDALQRARRLFRARKGGHGGTLDPLASGLLPCAFGQATKFLTDLIDADKTYLATIRLGQTSSTGDGEGQISDADPAVPAGLSASGIEQVLATFTGQIEQMPPMYSALKHQGKPLYKYARKGQDVERRPRTVTIASMALTAMQLPDLQVRVRCSKGTYIRVLAEDIGSALGCGAYLAGLVREQVGRFAVDAAVSLDELQKLSDSSATEQMLTHLQPVDAMLAGLPLCELARPQAKQFCHGQAVRFTDSQFSGPLNKRDSRCRVYERDRFLGLATIDGQSLAPRRLVVNEFPV